ncbi:MAG: PorP/SprF family type IX secretion system membrane protein [Chloroflexia bacterium]|nr:PorP/SprF family type IX secretion system membrane protein [Chloroflexia bacterium]
MRKYFIFILIISLIGQLKGQDIHFSNYFASPLSLNPANTGNYSGNWRAMGNYRQQGDNNANSYTTSTLSYDRPIYILNEKASAGLIYIYDNSANNTLLVNKIYLSAGYFQRISKNSYLHIGLQAGFVHKSFNLNNLTLPDQFDITTGYFNSQISTLDYFEKQSLSYIDLNWGLIWSRKTAGLTTEIGVGMFHYNAPEEVFLDGNDRLNPRYQVHGLAKIRILDNFYFKPKTLYTLHSKANEFIIGSDIGIILKENEVLKDFYVGAHYRGGYQRNPDAVIFVTGFIYKDFDIGFAYDLGISGQKITKYTGNAFEISLVFTRPETKITERSIPCDIF